MTTFPTLNPDLVPDHAAMEIARVALRGLAEVRSTKSFQEGFKRFIREKYGDDIPEELRQEVER